MEKVTMYKCEKCGRYFEKASEAVSCEKSEVGVEMIEKVRYGYLPNGKKGAYPVSVDVVMKDGRLIRYSASSDTLRMLQ